MAKKAGGQKKLPTFAVFGVGPARFMIVRPPTRAYAYGSLLNAYLLALRYARARGLAVYFLARRDEPGASLTSLRADTVRVIPPAQPTRMVMWTLWSLRVAWGHLRSPGRVGRSQVFALSLAANFVRSFADLHRRFQNRVHQALTLAWKALAERLKAQPKPQPVLLGQIKGLEAGPAVFARLDGRDEERCRRQARALGIDLDRPMVALHAREPGWRTSLYVAGDRPMDAARNASLNTYAAAIRQLRAHGYQIVRLGDSSMSRVPSDLEVVDLAHESSVDSLFELWVVARSALMIGCDSGPVVLATLAGTPLLTVNSLHLSGYMQLPMDRFICKLPYRPGSREPMTLAEMVAAGYTSSEALPREGDLDVAFRDNSEEEILEAVEEMLTLLSLPSAENRPTAAQLAYRRLLEGRKLKRMRPGEGHIGDGFARRWLGVPLEADAASG